MSELGPIRSGETEYRSCYFCDETNSAVIESHHVVPNEVVHTKQDEERESTSVTVDLCANCHRKTHELLDPLISYFGKKMRERKHTSDFVKGCDIDE